VSKHLAGAQNLHSRYDSVLNSAVQAPFQNKYKTFILQADSLRGAFLRRPWGATNTVKQFKGSYSVK
jgi:hypothetical protein